MMQSERELHAQDAINQFVKRSCVFILPGTEGRIASEVGSGVIITTKSGHLTVLTAKHVAEGARGEEYRLGYFGCLNPLPNFVAGIILFPGDVDVALLIVKDEIAQSLKDFAISSGLIPEANFEIQEKDSLVLNGFPAQVSYYSKERSQQGFWVITYWCLVSETGLDEKGRYQVEWKDAVRWRSDKTFELPSPKGISGGPLWRFSKPPSSSIWSAGDIGKIIGIQSAWDRKETVLIEPAHTWARWFHESIEKVDKSFG